MCNFRDSAAAHRSAPFLARLVACGLLGRAEALAALLHAAAPARVSPCGRQARLMRVESEALLETIRGRGDAAQAARAALRPLLRARASQRQLVSAAAHAAGSLLNLDEIEALTIDALARHLRTGRRCRRPHAIGAI